MLTVRCGCVGIFPVLNPPASRCEALPRNEKPAALPSKERLDGRAVRYSVTRQSIVTSSFFYHPAQTYLLTRFPVNIHFLRD